MPRKKTIEEVIESFASRGLKLTSFSYKDTKTKLDCIDKYGYKYKITYSDVSDIRTKSNAMFDKSNPYTIENIHRYININNLKCQLISTEYQSMNKDKMEFECECGNKYSIKLFQLMSLNQDTCPECSRKRGAGIRAYSFDELNSRINSYGYKLLEGYKQSPRKLYYCDKDGYKYMGVLRNFDSRNNKNFIFNVMNPFTVHNIKRYLNINNIPCTLSNKTTKINSVKLDKMYFHCAECGEEYQSVLYEVLYQGRHRCMKCTKCKSNLEYRVEEYLKECNIKYISQHRFKDCRNKNALPFDFYLHEHRTAIEVQGSQHYTENELFAQSLDDRKHIDDIKREYCKKNNIALIEIPYWHIQNNYTKKAYKETINNILNQK